MLLTHQWILVAADCLLCSAGWVSEIDAVSFSKRECAHSVHSAPPAPLVWISIFSFSFYARLCLFSQRVCMPLSCAVITNTVSIHVPPPAPGSSTPQPHCYHFARPPSLLNRRPWYWRLAVSGSNVGDITLRNESTATSSSTVHCPARQWAALFWRDGWRWRGTLPL